MAVVQFRTGREPAKSRSVMETRIFTAEQIGAWRVPSFQRPVRVNAKVQALAEEIARDGGVIPGVVTLGTIKGDSATYIVDGQHRLEAFRICGLPVCLGDFRLCQFDSMAAMASEFVQLNSALVRMRPDDVLRGLEASLPALAKIRRECRFVGYDQIRRNSSSSPVVGMSITLRTWAGSVPDTPIASTVSATQIAESLTEESAEGLVQFLNVAHTSFGREVEYARLWGGLNLGLCMWLWRRLVKDSDRTGARRYVHLSVKQFSACLMALSADGHYLDWLQGRALTDRDRSACYTRIKRIWAARLKDEVSGMLRFPQPAWAAA
jgi:hypothetical protein